VSIPTQYWNDHNNQAVIKQEPINGGQRDVNITMCLIALEHNSGNKKEHTSDTVFDIAIEGTDTKISLQDKELDTAKSLKTLNGSDVKCSSALMTMEKAKDLKLKTQLLKGQNIKGTSSQAVKWKNHGQEDRRQIVVHVGEDQDRYSAGLSFEWSIVKH
jgi:hypothetical protein